jgi:type 1 glutamine amidotransferase
MKNLINSVVFLAFIAFLTSCSSSTSALAQRVNWEKVNILLYTKNGKGFVHDNIPNSIKAIKALGGENGFTVDASEDPADFTEDNLKKYDAIVFSNTNNDVFDTDAQKVAFMRYIQAGGGFVGIHSASGTERQWKWFKQLLGGTFLWHEPYQEFTVRILEKDHPSLAHLPRNWEREDELYYLTELNPDLNILAVNDMTTLTNPNKDRQRPKTFGNVFPSVWSHEFDGGRQWYTSLGHNKEDYKDPNFRKHILGGIQWVIGDQEPLDYSKAYAQSPNDKVKH